MPSGKAERMPSICAQYDNANPAPSAHGLNTSIGTGTNSLGSGTSLIAITSTAGPPASNANGANHGSSGGEGSGSSPESGPRYHEVPLSLNPLPLQLPLPLSLTGAFARQTASVAQALAGVALKQPLLAAISNGDESPNERQPLDYSMGMFGLNKSSI